MIFKVTSEDIEKILGFNLEENLKKRITDFNLEYRDLSTDERNNYIKHVKEVLDSNITKSGEHRITEWENGWEENLKSFRRTKNINDLIPKYHGKNRIVRWGGDVVMPITENFDYKIHICIVDAILQHYLKGFYDVFELGCGPAYHLVRLKDFNKDLNLFGTDWTVCSQQIISQINSILNIGIYGYNLNFFEPDYTISVPTKSALYTVAALEQIGDNFKPIMDFILSKNFDLCIHLEPIDELLDVENEIDDLSIKYFRKRNYLQGFLPYLEELERQNKIKIITKKRTYSGSYFIEGHSLIVWKKL